ncbi:hypothetical protein [Pelagibacterium lacus]|uniref:hypothetical protein n=1 Tax=Pelagibacterium lacus TaxID=2282655 RepID=UPI0011C05BB1|nr:hypothetical protein [Pelagibacterium lacus]
MPAVTAFIWATLPFASLLHFTGFTFASLSLLAAAAVGTARIILAFEVRKVNKKLFWAFLPLVLLTVFSALPIFWLHLEFSSFISGLLSQTIAVLGLIGYVETMIRYEHFAKKGAILGLYFFTSIATFEFLALLSGQTSLKLWINTILSGQSSSRIIVTGFEPSIASRISAFNIGLLLFLHSTKPRYIYYFLVFSNVLVFFMSFSLIGFFIPVSFLILLSLSKIRFLFSWRVVSVIFVICLLGLFLVVFSWDSIAATHAGRRVILAVRTPIEHWAYLDGSTALRLLNQIVAVRIFLDAPLGIGAGQFFAYFSDYSGDLFVPVRGLGEVRKAFENETANPQSIFMRMVVEGGILSLSILIVLSIWVVSKLRQFNLGELFFLSFIIVSAGQTASFGFSHIWAGIAIILSGAIHDHRMAKRKL